MSNAHSHTSTTTQQLRTVQSPSLQSTITPSDYYVFLHLKTSLLAGVPTVTMSSIKIFVEHDVVYTARGNTTPGVQLLHVSQQLSQKLM